MRTLHHLLRASKTQQMRPTYPTTHSGHEQAAHNGTFEHLHIPQHMDAVSM